MDVSQYQTIEECLSATWRVTATTNAKRFQRIDTLPRSVSEATQPRAAEVTETAQKCATRFSAASVPIDNWYYAFGLFNYANRTLAADSLLRRRLSMLPKTMDSSTEYLRGAVLDSAIGVSLKIKPVHLTGIDPLIRELVGIPRADIWVVGASLYSLLVETEARHDTAYGRWVAEAFDTVAQRITPHHRRNSKAYRRFVDQYQRAIDFLADRALKDSLRNGTAGYVSLKQNNWQKANKVRSKPLPIGQLAPSIQAEFWFTPPSSSRDSAPVALATAPLLPTKGRPAILVELVPKCRGLPWAHSDTPSWACFEAYAVLRRLAHRFPTVGITLISQTHGAHWLLEPPSPADEARLLSRWWQGFHRIPATLAVSSTKFWRLPNPDRRRIDERTDNDLAYSFGGTLEHDDLQAYLIDENGIVVDIQQLSRVMEESWNELLTILVSR